MSSSRVKALRTLVKVRKRQGERLDAALADARRVLDERNAAVDEAVAGHARCVEAEQAAQGERESLMNASFTPAALRAIDFRIDDRRVETAQAQRGVSDRRKAVEQQAAAVNSAQAAIRRNEQRIEGFESQIETLLREREAAIEEAAEEETEETSTARLVARQRAAREVARHE